MQSSTKKDLSNKDIVIYQTPNNDIKIDVRLEQDNIWLTQKQIEVLFESDVNDDFNINENEKQELIDAVDSLLEIINIINEKNKKRKALPLNILWCILLSNIYH